MNVITMLTNIVILIIIMDISSASSWMSPRYLPKMWRRINMRITWLQSSSTYLRACSWISAFEGLKKNFICCLAIFFHFPSYCLSRLSRISGTCHRKQAMIITITSSQHSFLWGFVFLCSSLHTFEMNSTVSYFNSFSICFIFFYLTGINNLNAVRGERKRRKKETKERNKNGTFTL